VVFFDWISIIQKLKDEGLTHEQINEKIGLTKKNIDDHSRLLNNILPSILDFAKKHQIGRGNKKLPNGNFNFTEGWFRNSGFFDWLSIIQKLKDEGLTQKDIGEKIGWKKSYLSYHNQLLEKISTQVLDFAKTYQNGRVEEKSTNVEFNFTEGWFRNSGFFDWLSIIQKLKDEGLTQKDIGEKIGWSNKVVSHHNQIMEKISTQVLDFTKSYQNGRVDKKSTSVEFDFTEGWFRNSGFFDWLSIIQKLKDEGLT